MILYVVIGIVGVIIIYELILFNGLIKLQNRVDEAFATMDVYLKKRWDLVPNLVEVVQGYAKYEKETLESVVRLRNKTYDSLGLDDKLQTNEELGRNIQKIMVLAENYPELRAEENFRNLSKELVQVEDDILNARKYYNGVVRIYNNKLEVFPNNLGAKIFGFKIKKYFMARTVERENVKIKLD